MNLKNMRRLRQALRSRKNSVGFDMADWFLHNGRALVSPAAICRAVEKHPCGTVACLGGHAALLAWQSRDVPRKQRAYFGNVAQEWLGLDDDQAQQLFNGQWPAVDDITIWDITKVQAITELTRLIDMEK